MEFIYFVNLIFIFVLNALFFFSGICLNSLVIVSFWRSVQLRKKLCYFTIMVLSSCDLLAVLTNHPFTALTAMLWLTEKISVYPEWLMVLFLLSSRFVRISVLALFVMNVDRYLATHYPIFHRTSLTKGKVLTLFIVLVTAEITVAAMSTKNWVISYDAGLLIFLLFSVFPMLLINYKLLTVARKSRNNRISPEMKKSFSLKNISTCLLAVACLLVLSIPSSVYIVLRQTSKETEFTLDDAELTILWARTIASMNSSTFNCLIFYWKNKALRTEGMKVIKSMKICRTLLSCSAHSGQADNNGI